METQTADLAAGHLAATHLAAAQVAAAQVAALEQLTTQLAEVKRLKQNFVMGLNHEIRTPINGIMGMMDLLLETPLSAEQREFASVVRVCAQDLFDLLRPSLDFSSFVAKSAEIDFSEFDVAETIESVVCEQMPRAEAKGIELICNVDEGVPTLAMGDVLRFREALTQLLRNAIKFTESGEVEVLSHGTPADANGFDLTVSVRDTGIGIDPRKIDGIFESFHQIDGGLARRYSGVGLGLALTQQLITLMRGRISVESQPEVGSAFTFTIPLIAASGTGKQAWHRQLDGMKALLIVPNQRTAHSLGNLLAQFRMEHTKCSSGAEAMRAIAAGANPRVILLDDGGGRVDLESVSQDLKRVRPGTPLVWMLGSTGKGRPPNLSVATCDSELAKPVRRYTLYDALLSMTVGHPEPGARRRILLAEDNDISRRLVSKILRESGYLVDCAEDGRKALEIVRSSGAYDPVLMDLQMPNMNGIDATVEIRKLPAGSAVPIVALTAEDPASRRTACRDAGMNGYLSKPIRSEELLTEVRRYLLAETA